MNGNSPKFAALSLAALLPLLAAIEMVEWNPSKDNRRLGTYSIRFLPEAAQEREGFLVETWPENNNGPDFSGPLLTPIRGVCGKAPSVPNPSSC